MTKLQVTPKKQHIYIEAAKLFRDKGYPSTSMRDLAQQVGLEPSSLYSHIRSKEEILQTICFDCANKFLDGIREILKRKVPASVQLRAVIELHVSIAFDDPSSITVFNDEWRFLSEPFLSDFLQMRRSYEGYLREILKQGVDSREFRDIDQDIAMRTILSSIRWVHWRHHKTHDVGVIVDAVTDILLHGFLK